MTPNEKLVWAAAFAQSFIAEHSPSKAAYRAWITVIAMRTHNTEADLPDVRTLFEEMCK